MKLPKWKFTRLQIIVHIAAWLLVAWLLFDFFTDNLTINPYQAATQRTGKYAIIFLVLTLSITPINTIFGFRKTVKARRTLGLYTFMFAVIHFFIFAGLDYGFDWSLLIDEIIFKRYTLVGSIAFIILLVLAITSYKWWMKRLGKKWKYLHKFVYLAGVLVVIHYAWAKKGDIFKLQGDIVQPLIFGIIVALLLFLRIPVVRRSITHLRGHINHRLTTSSVPKISPN